MDWRTVLKNSLPSDLITLANPAKIRRDGADEE